MAKLKKNRKGAPPKMEETKDIMGSDTVAMKMMNFNVPEAFKNEFKLFAVGHKMTMTDLLKESFGHYKDLKK